ncbi:DUF742 domain-containing protein [Streptomyces sp. NPDC001455]|uniref:DUF742 domain-containing protein n=1 Tax=Streptomyces sp. NPDC001455 TaxID=3154518 RepID=UPI0033219577
MTGPAAGGGGLVRPYVRTRGLTSPSHDELRLESLVTAAVNRPDAGGLTPDERAVLDLCRPSEALSVSEIAAYLGQPPTLVKILVSGLADHGHVATFTPPATSEVTVLERVLHGLRALPA